MTIIGSDYLWQENLEDSPLWWSEIFIIYARAAVNYIAARRTPMQMVVDDTEINIEKKEREKERKEKHLTLSLRKSCNWHTATMLIKLLYYTVSAL